MATEKSLKNELFYQKLSFKIAEFAGKTKDDALSNKLAVIADKVANYGKPFTPKLTREEKIILTSFLKENNNGRSDSL